MAKRKMSWGNPPAKRAKYVKYATGMAGGVIGYTMGGIPGAVKGAEFGFELGTYTGRKSSGKTFNKKGVEYNGVTQQRDSKMAYKKRRMPKYKKRIWKKFVKKVNAVEIKDRGLQVFMLDNGGGSSISPGAQWTHAVHLYGKSNINNERGASDLFELQKDVETAAMNINDPGLGPNNAYPQIATTNNKCTIRMQSAVLQVVWKNNGAQPIILKIYHLWYNADSNATSFGDAVNDVETFEVRRQQGTVGGVTDPVTNDQALTLSRIGSTLFDEPQLLSRLNCTIKTVREIYLLPNQHHSMSIRDPKNYSIDLNSIRPISGVAQTGYVDRRLTESIVWSAQNYNNAEASIEFRAHRTYRYTIEGIRTVRTGVRTV